MKRILIAVLLALPLLVTAKQKRDDSKYLTGAVPEENGIVTFRKSFSVTGKQQAEIYDVLKSYVQSSLLTPAIQDIRTRIISDDKTQGTLVARVEEYMTFKHKPFSLDRTRFRYQFEADVVGNKVTLKVSQITYYYNEDMDGNNGVNYKAEEWISDKEALNKAGTKLYPRSGKFRRLTVDRVEAIFDGAMDAFSEKLTQPEPAKKQHAGIVEE